MAKKRKPVWLPGQTTREKPQGTTKVILAKPGSK
jgi:hypothetical protein